ncbi:hypothetical protein [Vitiosangium sp. GDMCC 1.1324]|uniref:hypothetical protein n=1 Tax=Vitiosangium sp. (strain GDMCC 1.1324) TaxID=2138576 RepID=UPI000D33B348|nr:hypothetical protein [Vitiosangium sp. GDMCC 1.1324]PTL79084.1 hypothetical protein DAT35_36355 [Vitiosangium sp. GDMCC 1.1324]
MIIVTKREGPCRACGGRIRKGEYADFTAEKGAAHPEAQCSSVPARYRPNLRAGACRCGTWVKAGQGRLRLVEDAGGAGGKKSWAVDCDTCASL